MGKTHGDHLVKIQFKFNDDEFILFYLLAYTDNYDLN